MRRFVAPTLATVLAVGADDARGQASQAAPDTAAAEEGAFFEIMPADVLEVRQAVETLALPKSAGGSTLKSLFAVYRDLNVLNLDAKRMIRVCFMGETDETHQYIVDEAKGWEIPGSSLKFDFGPPSNRHRCSTGDAAVIRVGFSQPGHWSLVGHEALPRRREQKSTMNFSSVERLGDMSPNKRRYVIQHEFGHAIGLYHEHQNPLLDCHAHMEWTTVRQKLKQPPYGLTDSVIDQNFARLDRERLQNSTPDDVSVMLYSMPKVWYKDAAPSLCHSAALSPISPDDKQAIRTNFPVGLPAYFAVRNDAYRQYVDAVANLSLSPLERHDAQIVAGALTPFPPDLTARKLQYEAATIEKVTRVIQSGSTGR